MGGGMYSPLFFLCTARSKHILYCASTLTGDFRAVPRPWLQGSRMAVQDGEWLGQWDRDTGRRKVELSFRTPTADRGSREQNTQLLAALDRTFCQRDTLLDLSQLQVRLIKNY